MTAADVQMLIDAAVRKERERCAWIADQYATGDDGGDNGGWTACAIADEIRGLAECASCSKKIEVAEHTQAMRDGNWVCAECECECAS